LQIRGFHAATRNGRRCARSYISLSLSLSLFLSSAAVVPYRILRLAFFVARDREARGVEAAIPPRRREKAESGQPQVMQVQPAAAEVIDSSDITASRVRLDLSPFASSSSSELHRARARIRGNNSGSFARFTIQREQLRKQPPWI
jgi:hypothetical protein